MLVITKVGAHLTAGASHHHVHLPHEAIPELLLSCGRRFGRWLSFSFGPDFVRAPPFRRLVISAAVEWRYKLHQKRFAARFLSSRERFACGSEASLLPQAGETNSRRKLFFRRAWRAPGFTVQPLLLSPPLPLSLTSYTLSLPLTRTLMVL